MREVGSRANMPRSMSSMPRDWPFMESRRSPAGVRPWIWSHHPLSCRRVGEDRKLLAELNRRAHWRGPLILVEKREPASPRPRHSASDADPLVRWRWRSFTRPPRPAGCHGHRARLLATLAIDHHAPEMQGRARPPGSRGCRSKATTSFQGYRLARGDVGLPGLQARARRCYLLMAPEKRLLACSWHGSRRSLCMVDNQPVGNPKRKVWWV
jgi:hypothetical protein